MMKHILIFLIFTVLLSADIYYSQGLGFFKNKNYKNSYEKFLKAYETEPKNEKVNFYLGRCQYELGFYQDALTSFERVLDKTPNNTRVKLEIAQTYLMMGLYDNALSYFAAVLKDELPAVVRQKVEYNIEHIQRKQTKDIYNITFSLGLLYESNIDNSADSGEYTIYIPDTSTSLTLSSNGAKRNSLVGQATIGINHYYKLDDKILLVNSMGTYIKKYPSEYKDKNIYALSLNTNPTYLYDKEQKISLGIGWDHVWYGGDNFLDVLYLSPGYKRLIDNKIEYLLSLKLGTKKYIKTIDKNRDSDFYQIQNSLMHLTDSYGMFSYGLLFGDESEKNFQRTDISKSNVKFSLSNRYSISQNFLLNTSLSYDHTKYKDLDINFLTKRKDKRIDLSFGLMYLYVDFTRSFHPFHFYVSTKFTNEIDL